MSDDIENGYFIIDESRAVTLDDFSKAIVQLSLEKMQDDWSILYRDFPIEEMKQQMPSPIPLSIEFLSYELGVHAFLIMNFTGFPQNRFVKLLFSLASEVFAITNDTGAPVYDPALFPEVLQKLEEYTIEIWQFHKSDDENLSWGPGAKVLGKILRMFDFDNYHSQLTKEAVIDFPLMLSNRVMEVKNDHFSDLPPKWVSTPEQSVR